MGEGFSSKEADEEINNPGNKNKKKKVKQKNYFYFDLFLFEI